MNLYSKLLRNIGKITYLGRLEEEMDRRCLDDVPRQIIRATQLSRVNEIWAHAVDHVPHYRDLSLRLSLPRMFRSLDEFSQRVPALSKKEVQPDPRRFLADTAGSGSWLQTTGSTGRPLWTFRGRSSHQRIRLDAHYQRLRYGVNWSDPGLLIWGGGGSSRSGTAGFWKRGSRSMAERLKNRWRIQAYALDGSAMEKGLDILQRHRIRFIYAYTSSAARFARFCAEGISFPHLDLVVISAEPEASGEMAFMKGVFGCPVAREYGAVEMGLIAADLPGSPLRVMEDSVFVETVPHESGMFDILCTNLHNRDFPLIRYRMEDLTSRELKENPRGPAALTDVAGRRNDLIFLPPDRWIHSSAMTHIIRRFPGVLGLQVVVEGERKVRVRLETRPGLDTADRERMRDKIKRVMGGKAEVIIEENVPFETTPGGKHRFVIRR